MKWFILAVDDLGNEYVIPEEMEADWNINASAANGAIPGYACVLGSRKLRFHDWDQAGS